MDFVAVFIAPREHSYPLGYDCTVALCDHQQEEDVTQDCRLGAAPCGACLGSTGVSSCLR